ncbi:MAG: histidinol dehydrogenase [Fimbriimonadaceae bacterium]|nr:histidinol dehydrogenase [Fimbriimonadaceae bacterium]
MRLCDIVGPDDPRVPALSRRRPKFDSAQADTVRRIIDDVAVRGAEAVLESARRFDAPGLAEILEEIDGEGEGLSEAETEALHTAAERIEEFHRTQLQVIAEGWEGIDSGWAWQTSAVERDNPEAQTEMQLGPIKVPMPPEMRQDRIESGMLGQRMLPIRRVGVYAPGGKASYPSSILMTAIPAKVAGCREIVAATPARPDGTLAPAVREACRLAGVTQVVKCGGAAGIAGLALGWPGFDRVDLIVGPGNTWVNEAKRQLWGTVGLTAYAGPSEVAVVCLPGFDPLHAAADLLTQVEHSDDNVGLLIAFSRADAEAVLDSAAVMAGTAERGDVLRAALRSHGLAVVCGSAEEAARLVDDFAPEHLALHGDEAEGFLGLISNAGCVALGGFTPQSAGDYASGPSHALPTSGAARFGSPVNVQDFLRFQTVTSFEREDLDVIRPVIETLAQMEGLPFHGRAASIRFPR